jgi:hypothetical protein
MPVGRSHVTNNATSAQFVFLITNSNRRFYSVFTLMPVPIRSLADVFTSTSCSHGCYIRPALCNVPNEIVSVSVLSVVFAENGEAMSVCLSVCLSVCVCLSAPVYGRTTALCILQAHVALTAGAVEKE